MKNKFFPTEDISDDDVKFVCYMIERISRRIKQPNKYLVNQMGYDEIVIQLSNAPVLHCKNPLDVEDEWICKYKLEIGNFDILDVNKELCPIAPTALQMGKVYKRLIKQTMQEHEDFAQAIIRVYNSFITKYLDNYNGSAYYEPSYFIARCYFQGSFS